jgi:hypothetical protein
MCARILEYLRFDDLRMEIRLTGEYFYEVFFYLLITYFFIIYTYSIKGYIGYANQNKSHHCESSHSAWGSFVLLLRGFLSDRGYSSGEGRFNTGYRNRTDAC